MATRTLTLLFVLLSSSYVFAEIVKAREEGCHPHRYWLSCLINMCRFAKCPAEPGAECRKVKTRCHGCKYIWFRRGTDERADCRPKKKVCQEGVRVLHCALDSCRLPCRARAYAKARCRQNHCGVCRAEYYVDRRWQFCPTHRVRFRPVMLPSDASIMSRTKDGQLKCAVNETRFPCTEEVCRRKSCPGYPGARCVPNGCGMCHADWYLGSVEVNCQRSDCPLDVLEVRCVVDPCKYFAHHCPNHPGAECVASHCRYCHAKFYENGKEVKDCGPLEKRCPPGQQITTCRRSPCPSPVCYSNKRLMCRTNPCGGCNYEYVDVYNGEIVHCEVPSPFSRRPRKHKIKALSALDLGRKPSVIKDTVQPGAQERILQPGAVSSNGHVHLLPKQDVIPSESNVNRQHLKELLNAKPNPMHSVPKQDVPPSQSNVNREHLKQLLNDKTNPMHPLPKIDVAPSQSNANREYLKGLLNEKTTHTHDQGSTFTGDKLAFGDGQILPGKHIVRGGKLESTKARTETGKVVFDGSVPAEVNQPVHPPTKKLESPIKSHSVVDSLTSNTKAEVKTNVAVENVNIPSSANRNIGQTLSSGSSSVHTEFDSALSEKALVNLMGQTSNKNRKTIKKHPTKNIVQTHEIPKKEFQIASERDPKQGIPINLELLMMNG